MSSTILPVLEHASLAMVITPAKTFPVIENSPTPEYAAKLLCQAAPPATVQTALVAFGCESLEIRQRCVEALRNEGYTNIESVDHRSIKLSESIYGLPLNCAISEPVFVNCKLDYVDNFCNYPIYVIQKRENGWQILETRQHPEDALSKYPSTRNIVIYKNVSKAIKDEVKKLFPGLKLHLCGDLRYASANYMMNRVNNGNLNGYKVLPYCNVNLVVQFSNIRKNIPLTDRVPPFTVSKTVDVGDASVVKIYDECFGPVDYVTQLKTFEFKSKAFRKVLVTVSVDKTLIPSVTLRTASTYKPRDRQTPVIYAVWLRQNGYFLTVISEDHTSNESGFYSKADVFTYIAKSSAIPATKAIYFVFSPENSVSQIREFRDFAAEADVYPGVQLIFNDSLTLSLTLDRAGISVLPGQMVTVMTSKVSYVVQREGKLLQIVDWYLPQNYDINKHDVDTVIVDNEGNVFTQTDLEYLRLKYYPRAVIVLPGIELLDGPLPKFFWSRVNGLEYGGNFFNNFGFFEIHIEGDGVAETVDTRFKAIPYTVTADVKVGTATTLDVTLFRSDKCSELLQKFAVPVGAKAVRFTICAESACDITITMDVIDETEIKRQPEKPKVIENPEHSNPKTSTVDLVVQFGTKCETVTLTEHLASFTVSKEVDVGDASEVTVRALSRSKIDSPATVKTLNFKKSAFRKALITVSVDQDCTTELTLRTASTYKPAPQPTETGDSVDADLSQLKLDSPSMTVLTFTSDNRVLVEAGETYTGDEEFLAYVRLASGKAPEVGQKAFDALKKHSGSVFYGWLIYRTQF